MSVSTIPPLSVWPCGEPLLTQEVSDLHQSVPITWPLHRDGASRGTCLHLGLLPWDEGFGIPNPSPDPLVRRAGRDHPILHFPIAAWFSLEGKGRRKPSEGKKLSPPCHPRGKNYGCRTPPGVPGSPHSGTPVASQCPLTHTGWHALEAGAWHHDRRVVAPVATVPNCPRQESICASLQCSCRSQWIVSG